MMSTGRPLQTDKSQSTYGTACSILDIGTSNLTVSNGATISLTAAPASAMKAGWVTYRLDYP